MNRIVLALLETLHSEVYADERREVEIEADVQLYPLSQHMAEFDRLHRTRSLSGLQRIDIVDRIPVEDFVAMERLVERHQVFPLTGEDKRGEIVGAISFWCTKLEAGRVDAVFLATSSPHWPFNYAIYAAARLLEIPVFSASTEFLTKRVHLYSGLKARVLPRRAPGSAEAIDAFLQEAAKKLENPPYINAYLQAGNSLLRFYWQAAKNIRRVFKRLATGDVWCMFDARQVPWPRLTYAISYLRKAARSLAAIRRLREGYRRNAAQVTVDQVPEDAVIFYASYQPEATTCPDAAFFHDFRLALKTLVDLGYKVYYREHPTVFLYTIGQMLNFVGVYRDAGFYDDLTRMGVKVVDLSVSHDFLLSRFNIFATCTGTVALQAAAQGKHVIVLGKPWYVTPPGIHSCFNGTVLPPAECLASPAPHLPALRAYFARDFGAGFQNVYGLQGYAPEPSATEYKAFLHHLVDAARRARGAPRAAAPVLVQQEFA